MSSYGEKRDRRDEILNRDLSTMQAGIQNASSYRRSHKSYSKKQEAMICIGFLILLMFALAIVIVVSLG